MISTKENSLNEHQQNNSSGFLDTFAVFCSALCIIHCLTLPVFITILPALNVIFIEDKAFHLILLVIVLPISLLALTIGCRKHKDYLTIIAGAIGLLLLILAAVFGHSILDQSYERSVTSLGSLVLAYAHIRNYRICRKNDSHHES